MNTQTAFRLICILALAASFLSSPPTAVQAAGTLFVNDDVNDGLAAHWKFDEAGSGTVIDFAGTNHAALVDTASQSNASLPVLDVPNPNSLALDGINDYAQIGAPTAALALSTSFTLTAWIRRAATNQYDAIYDSGTQANKWWVFIADNGALPVGTKNNRLGFGERGVVELYSTQSITDANWHHIAVIKNGDAGNNVSFYVDGISAGTGATGTITTPSGSARIGALLDGAIAAQFGGNLDDLLLYNRALSAAEVARLAGGQGCVTDGTSWATAFRELQCALSSAAAGDDIWLAGGVYRPGTAREVSFNLVNGVNLLGGFAGTETSAGQRPPFDPGAPLTRLTGDVLGNDNPVGFVNYTENSRNVVIGAAGVGAVLDGLAIQQGNQDVASGSGAGLKVDAGAVGLTLSNVLVSANLANGEGGGIHNRAPLSLANVTLFGNRSMTSSGGGMFSSAAVTADNLSVYSNISNLFGAGLFLTAPVTIHTGLFQDNQVSIFYGGGINTNADLTLSGVTFINNQAPFGGGAIESSGALLSVTGSTFTNNRGLTFTGGAIDAFSQTINITNSIFNANTTTQDGGAIFSGSGNLTVVNSQFTNNQAKGGNCLPICSSGNGGAIATLGTLTVDNSTFSANTARLDGGAIAAKGSTAVLHLSTFANNQAGFPANTGNPSLGLGGAVFSSSPLVLDTVDANHNTAQASGGAVYSTGTLTMLGGSYQLNTASTGGGVWIDTSGSLENTLISDNTASSLGGGLMLGNGSLTLTNTTLSGNTVADPAGQGGGLNIVSGTVNINGGSFTANSAANGGGLFNAGSLTTTGVIFSANTATTGGGIINVATMTDTASSFDSNVAVNGGGVAFAAGDTTTGHGSFTGTVFTNNSATKGGGLHSISDVSLTNATFTGNQATTATGDGGGMLTSGGLATLTGVAFNQNHADRFGGAARLFGAKVEQSSFTANTAVSEGGGLLLTNNSQVIASIFQGNNADLSGAISMQGPADRSVTLQVINSLFYDNTRTSTAGAADMRLFDLTITLANNTFGRPGAAGQRSVDIFRSNLDARNNIWNGYATSLAVGQSAAGTTVAEDYNLFFNAPLSVTIPPGAHSLTADPQFANPSADDFSLKATSPAIDSGDNTILPASILTDLAGLPRFRDIPSIPNTGVGTPPVDRGAYEYMIFVYLPLITK